jgi:hypothetical protein
MIFKLAEAAEKNGRRLDGHNQLPKIILGVRFTDGIEVVKPKAQAAAASPLPSPRFSDSSRWPRSLSFLECIAAGLAPLQEF